MARSRRRPPPKRRLSRRLRRRCRRRSSMTDTACGFVAIVGEPNAGKSTLINKLVGGKVSIVTPKVQTTRFNIRGVCIYGTSQIIFVDTPGIFDAEKSFEKAMVQAAWAG